MEAFEGSKDVLKTIQEKAKFYGKIVAKEAKKAVGIHVGKVSEANPRYYLVVAPQGAMVREGIELDSPPVHGLRPGDIVACVDISGRRARIIDPMEGWVSIRTDSNDPILEVTIAPEKEVQVAQMEKRFEKLKAQQQGTHAWESSTSEPVSESVTTDSASSSVTTMKTKLAFRTGADSEGSKTDKVPVPKLSAPGIKKPSSKTGLPDRQGRTDNLLDLETLSAPPTQTHAPVVNDPFAELLDTNPVMPNVKSVPAVIEAKAEQASKGPTSNAPQDFDAWFA